MSALYFMAPAFALGTVAGHCRALSTFDRSAVPAHFQRVTPCRPSSRRPAPPRLHRHGPAAPATRPDAWANQFRAAAVVQRAHLATNTGGGEPPLPSACRAVVSMPYDCCRWTCPVQPTWLADEAEVPLVLQADGFRHWQLHGRFAAQQCRSSNFCRQPTTNPLSVRCRH
jgi:hypothetical protein